MSQPIQIEIQTGKRLSAASELEIVRAAFARKLAPEIRVRLVSLLLLRDHFDEVIALLGQCEDLSFDEAIMLAHAYIAGENDEANRLAGFAARRALALAGDDDTRRAVALALCGKTETRLGELDAARACLREALELDPHEKDACKRLAALDFAADDAPAVLTLTGDLAAQGAAHARLFAARGVAHARLGDMDLARAMMDNADLRFAGTLAPPPGWDSIEAFNAALAQELLAHPALRFERYGTASELTWRIDAPVTGRAPLVSALLDRITETLSAHIEGIADVAHPWVAARPTAALLRSWCVITESDGFENWHVHQFGWMSGSYYVSVPDSIAHGETEDGCIAFGLPDDLAGEAAVDAFGVRVVRPKGGLMLAFPSHTYHRTFPHGQREKRICLAFDLRPA